MINAYQEGYIEEYSDSDEGCGYEDGDCDCDCHHYRYGYGECDECQSSSRSSSRVLPNFKTISSSVTDAISMSEKFWMVGKKEVALYVIMKISISYIAATNPSETNNFVRDDDNFEYYIVRYLRFFFNPFSYLLNCVISLKNMQQIVIYQKIKNPKLDRN